MAEVKKNVLTYEGLKKYEEELTDLKVNKRKEIADKIIRNDLSVRATERLAEKVKDELRPERRKRKKTSDADKAKAAEIAAVERELMTLLGTKVHIDGDDKRGKIELEYYSLDELNRLIDSLRDAFR